MRASGVVAIGSTLLMAVSALAATPPARTSFRATDLFALQFARSPQIAPNGRTIAYVRDSFVGQSDTRERTLWLLDIATRRQHQISGPHRSITSVAWSADGSRLAYVVSDSGRKPRITLLIPASGTTQDIESEEAPDSLTWSMDSGAIAFTRFVAEPRPPLFPAISRPIGVQRADPLRVYERSDFVSDRAGYARDGHEQLFVLDCATGAVTQRTRLATDVAEPAWAPDGSIVFSARRVDDVGREAGDTELWSLPSGSNHPMALTDHLGPDGNPVISPDGRHIAFIGYDERHRMDTLSRLYVIARDGSNRRVLTTTLDRSVEAPMWTADGQSVYVQYADQGKGRTVARVSLRGEIKRVAHGVTATQVDRPYISEGLFSIARDGTAAFAQSAPDRPLEVALARGTHVQRLTDLNGPLVASRRLATIRPLFVRAADGRRIDAWIMLPPGAPAGKRFPAILEIHGGPQTAYGPAWSSQFQLYAAAGYAIVFANYRGSGTYGQGFEDLIESDFPGSAYGDVQSAIDAAIAARLVDPARLYISGGSAGGAITAWTIGKTNQFRAAAIVKPLIDGRSIALTSDVSAFWLNNWFRALPWKSPSVYDAQSPLMLAEAINTPTVLIVGERDQRTPVSQALQLYRALQARKVPTALGIVPDRGHFDLADQPSQLADQTRLILAWFARFGGPAVPAE